MKKDPISKLYQQINSQELALLAFANLNQEDSLEHTRIVDAVPRRRYLCLDTTFTNYLHRVFHMASLWSIEYWRCRTQLMAVQGIFISTVIGLTDRDEEKDSALLDFYGEQMAAVEVALIEICDEYRIDINAVRQIAGITRDFKQENTPNADYLQEFKGYMRQLLLD
jgi:hypothetical protein